MNSIDAACSLGGGGEPQAERNQPAFGLAPKPGGPRVSADGRPCVRDSESGDLPPGCPPTYAEDRVAEFYGMTSQIHTRMYHIVRRSGCFQDYARPSSHASWSSYLPPKQAKCVRGSGRFCVLVEGERPSLEAWEYRLPTEGISSLWHELNIEEFEDYWRNHATPHVRFGWRYSGEVCSVWFGANGDLDEDRVCSTYVDGQIFGVEFGELIPLDSWRFGRGEGLRELSEPDPAEPLGPRELEFALVDGKGRPIDAAQYPLLRGHDQERSDDYGGRPVRAEVVDTAARHGVVVERLKLPLEEQNP